MTITPSILAVLALTLGGGLLLRGAIRRAWVAAGAGVLATLSLLLMGIFIVADRLTGAGINAAFLFHLGTGLDGATTAGFGSIVSLGLGFIAAAVLAGVAVARFAVANAAAPRPAKRVIAGFAALLAALALNPAIPDLAGLARISLAAPAKNLVKPPDTYATVSRLAFQTQHRNLVYLFLESFERSYLDPARFPGLAPNLTRLDREALSFTDIRGTGLASWTVAGMAASLCGTPLFGGAGNSMTRIGAFMPGASCLSDLLTAEGYTADFLGGASLDFAGKGLFLQSHGFDRAEGRDELAPLLAPGETLSSWGLYDDTLYRLAADRFETLAAKADPFALVLLTLDTHHPSGYPSPSCARITYGDGTDPMLNTVHCADKLAGAFIDRLRASPAFKDTVLVVASDHLAMPNTVWDRLEAGPRQNLLMMFGTGVTPRQDPKPGATLDIAPTTATLIGAPTAALGFGRTLLGTAPTLTQANAPLDDYLATQNNFLAALWAFPDLGQGITVDLASRSLTLGSSRIGYPALILLTPPAEGGDSLAVSEIQFETYDEDQPLSARVEALDSGTRFVWIDRCGDTAPIMASKTAAPDDLCAVWGALGAAQLQGERLAADSPLTFSRLSADLAALDVTDARADARRSDWRRDRLVGADPVLSVAADGDFGGHLLLRSAGFGTGASHITDVNTESRTDLARGITVTGLRSGAAPIKLAHFDTCGYDGTIEDVPSPYHTISQVLTAYDGFFGGYAVLTHDSAICDQPADLHTLFSGTPFLAWPAIGYRTPYIGFIDAAGLAHEYSGPAGTALVVEARDLILPGAAATQQPRDALPRIAHAGGALATMTYTNALEALAANHTAYDLIEIDLSWTADGALVCLHDWADIPGPSGPGTQMSRAGFDAYAATLPYRPCVLESLTAWLRETPGIRIVTDVKADNLEALKIIAARYPDLIDRFVPQLYQPSEYPIARSLGFNDVIWTLYRFDGDDNAVLRWLPLMDLYGLVMPEAEARRGLARTALQTTGVRSWVHTVNDPETLKELRLLGVSEVMTDHLPP